MCILYTLHIIIMLLKVVSHDDLSVLSMSAMGLQKRNFDRGGGVSFISFFWIFLNFANHHTQYMYVIHYCTMVTIQRKPRLLPTHPD